MISYNEIVPVSPILRKYIECFWIFTASKEDKFRKVELNLPDGGVDLVFNFGSPYYRFIVGHKKEKDQVLTSSLVGQRLHPTAIMQDPERSIIAARFRPHGLQAFCNLALHEITNQFLKPGDIWRDFDRLEETLFETEENRVEKIESWLLSHFQYTQDRVLDESVKQLQKHKGNINLSTLYKHLGINKSTLEKKYKQKVGITPKNLASIYRFNHAIVLKAANPLLSFTNISYECGYCDQSHLIRDFNRFTGQSPTTYFEKRYSFTEIFSPCLLDGMFY